MPPQRAWVWVTARWCSTVCSAQAPAPVPSVEPAVAVTAAKGCGAPWATASITSRNSPEDDTASSRSPCRQANRPRATSPAGTAVSSGPPALPASSEASHRPSAT